MKIRKIYAIAVAIVMLFSIAAFSACANNEPQTLSEKKQSFLQGIWQSIDNFEFNEKYEYYKELYKAQVADDISKASSETDLYKIKNDARETMSKVMYYQYIAGPVRDWSVILINGKTEDGDYTITLHPSYTYPNRYRLKADYTAKDSGISIKAIMFEKTAGNETFTAKGEFVEDITRPDIIWDDSFGHEKYALCFVATKAGANIGCSVIEFTDYYSYSDLNVLSGQFADNQSATDEQIKTFVLQNLNGAEPDANIQLIPDTVTTKCFLNPISNYYYNLSVTNTNMQKSSVCFNLPDELQADSDDFEILYSSEVPLIFNGSETKEISVKAGENILLGGSSDETGYITLIIKNKDVFFGYAVLKVVQNEACVSGFSRKINVVDIAKLHVREDEEYTEDAKKDKLLIRSFIHYSIEKYKNNL